MTIFLKDPDATLDYTANWGDGYLNSTDSPAETISISTWSVDPADSPGLTIDSDSKTTTTANAYVSGGVSGQVYKLINTITTSAGRIDQRTFTIRIGER